MGDIVYMCISIISMYGALLLDVVRSKSLSNFIKSFKRFVSRMGVPNNIISDGGRNFVSVESQEFVNGLGVNWVRNMSLSPWYRLFFFFFFFNAWLRLQRGYCGKCWRVFGWIMKSCRQYSWKRKLYWITDH